MIEFITSKLRYKIMFFMIALMAISTFITMYIITDNIKKSNYKATQKSLAMLNQSIFQNIRTAMQTGNSNQIQTVENQSRKIDGVKNLFVAKSPALIELFSLNEKFTEDKDILKAFSSKQTIIIESEEPTHDMRMIQPMIASQVCLECHVNQKEGDVVGVIDLTFSLEDADKELYSTIVNVLLAFGILGLITLYSIFIALKKSTEPIEKLEEGIRVLTENEEHNTIDVDSSDEIGKVANYFNLYIEKIKSAIDKDTILLDEAQIIIENVRHGIYDGTITSTTSNKSLEKFKASVNEMIETTNIHLVNINNVLKQYSGYDYSNEVILAEIANDCVIAHLVKNINNVRDSILSQNSYVDKYVILSRTDLFGKITYASEAFCDISGYTNDELVGKPHNIVRHPDMPKEAFEDLWNTIKAGKIWQGEVKNRKKNGDGYWTFSTVGPSFDANRELIGYTSTRQDITQQKLAEELTTQVTNILDNANDGFLTFDRSLCIQAGYSKRSLEILSVNKLDNENIAYALFRNDLEKSETFEYGINLLLDTDDKEQQELLVSLLPNENKINGISFLIHYKIISNNEFMVILEDVTKRKDLEKAIEYENKIQKMIVVIATRKFEFLELKNDFEFFLNTIDERVDFYAPFEDNILKITQILHTFKGLFAQEELVNITEEIHNFESLVIEKTKNNTLDNKQLHYMLTNNKLRKALEKDLDFIAEILGDDFLETSDIITINQTSFRTFENEMLTTLDKNHINKNDFKTLVNDFMNLNQRSLKNMLKMYPKMVKNMAKNLNKEIEYMEIVGDPNILVQGNFNEFIKSLVHVFRNMIDHGIEDPCDRIAMGKEMQGTIKCSFKMMDGGDKIELKISDNGKGIDAHKIAKVAFEKNLITQDELDNLSHDEKLQLIFKENISTKEETSLMSGRGIGLNVVKHELDKIDGTVRIASHEGIGTKFIFELPSKLDYIEYEHNQEEEFSNCIEEVTKNYFQNNLNLSIKDISKVEDFILYNQYSIIKFGGSQEIFSIISCEDSFLKRIIHLYLEDGELTEELFNLYGAGTMDETHNTILGHTIPYLPYEYKDLVLSPPLNLGKEILEMMFSNNGNIVKKYSTPAGEFYMGTIFINKISYLLGDSNE